MTEQPPAGVTDASRVLLGSDVEAWLARHEQKELCRFVTVGSVDDGKSTLIGRLLFDTENVFDDQLAAVRRASAKKGEAIDLSLLTDGLVAEREQGITIDVAYRYFATERRKFIIADTPGHEQYTRNMATGASTADIAIILVDAELGVLAQTRRHATIARWLGVRHLVCAVNKMDLVDFDEAAYRRAADALSAFAGRIGFGSVHLVPVAAKLGENVARSGSERMPWYAGPTVLELLESLPVAPDRTRERFRFPIQLVLRPDHRYRAFAGAIASGEIAPGDEVVVLPSRRRTSVAAIDVYEGALERAHAPMSVAIRLADEVDASRGELLCKAGEEPALATSIEARLVWLDERPFDPKRALLLKHTSRLVPARIVEVVGKMSLDTLALDQASGIALNDTVVVRVSVTRPIFCDPYDVCRETGAFILIDAMHNGTVAAGMIDRALETRSETRGPVTSDERARRMGHVGAVVWLGPRTGQGGAIQGRAIEAQEIERHVFDGGLSTLLVHAGEAPEAALAVLVAKAASAGLCVLVEGETDALRTLVVGDVRTIDLSDVPVDEVAGRLGQALAIGLRP